MSVKEELVFDINMVMSVSSDLDIRQPSIAQKCLKYFEKKHILKSPVGRQYMYRLKQISDCSAPETCFVCKDNIAYDKVLCTSCMEKYSHGLKSFYKEKIEPPDFVHSFSDEDELVRITTAIENASINGFEELLEPVFYISSSDNYIHKNSKRKPYIIIAIASIICIILLFVWLSLVNAV